MVSEEIQTLRSRPRFRRTVHHHPNDVLEKFRDRLSSSTLVTGSVATHHVSVRITKSNEHFWSPQLGLEIEEDEAGSLIRGLYGPKPSIWTLFIFCYAVFGIGTLAMLFWGLSQWQIGQYPWALWFVPGGFLTIGGIYLLTQFGQKIGFQQLEILHIFFTETIDSIEKTQPYTQSNTEIIET